MLLFAVGGAACAPQGASDGAKQPPNGLATGTGATPATLPAVVLAPDNAVVAVPAPRLDRLLQRNLSPSVSLPEALLAQHLAEWRARSVGERIALWAQLFAGRDDNAYCFGVKPGGYVAESLLVQDFKFDCVSLFYRCTELARADSPRDAVLRALGTRFAGGDPTRVVSVTGGVNYDDPSHLDYSEDFAATGQWGRDVTREVGEAVPDTSGSSRYAANTRWFIPTDRIRVDRLRDGDLLFFVLNEGHEGARKLREQYGLLVGHQGIVHIEKGETYAIHAAQSDLQGIYKGNRVVEVPLLTYLHRVEKWKGVMVSRIEDTAPQSGSR
jgi:hypothetical protein